MVAPLQANRIHDEAMRPHRTEEALWLACSTERRAEVHERLIEIEDVLARDERLRECPQLAGHGVALRIAFADEDTEQDASHIRVENRRALAEREAANRPHRVPAEPLEREKRRFVAGKGTVVTGHGFARNHLQPLRPDVVAQRPPRLRDVLLVRPSQRFERGKALEPFVILGQYAIDLRLLQHHLGDQDVVRVVGFAPRQLAAVFPIPAEERLPESLPRCRGGQRERRAASARGRVSGHRHTRVPDSAIQGMRQSIGAPRTDDSGPPV